MNPTPISRRTVLAGTAALAATTAFAGQAYATGNLVSELERRHGRLIGLYARNLRTGRELTHRPDERFALCSTFKTFAVAAVLDARLVTPDRHALRRRVHYPPSLIAGDVWAPYTRQWCADGYIPTLGELCEVAVRDSDNGAANLVLQYIGGPSAVTRLLRDNNDRVTRLDRWEPDMSEFEPGQVVDTSTPRALGSSFAEFLLGRALPRSERDQLTQWLLGNRTNPPFRTVLPEGWTIADKTGSGGYATRNNVGIAWTDKDVPILVSCMTRAEDPEAERLDAPVSDAFRACIDRLA